MSAHSLTRRRQADSDQPNLGHGVPEHLDRRKPGFAQAMRWVVTTRNRIIVREPGERPTTHGSAQRTRDKHKTLSPCRAASRQQSCVGKTSVSETETLLATTQILIIVEFQRCSTQRLVLGYRVSGTTIAKPSQTLPRAAFLVASLLNQQSSFCVAALPAIVSSGRYDIRTGTRNN